MPDIELADHLLSIVSFLGLAVIAYPLAKYSSQGRLPVETTQHGALIKIASNRKDQYSFENGRKIKVINTNN